MKENQRGTVIDCTLHSPFSSVILGDGGGRKVRSEVKPGKPGGRCF